MPNVFLSGCGIQVSNEYIFRIINLTTHRLLSLHADYRRYAKEWLTAAKDTTDTQRMEIMFDSGAFTAWSKKQPDIEVKELLAIYKSAFTFCSTAFKEVWFINLDKIPGEPGRTATPDEIQDAIRVSDDNYKILHSELGYRVLPVFHQSEDVHRLTEIRDLNPEYICVSPRNDLREKDRRAWSARVHKLTKGVKTHGLAATGDKMMLEVPWHSVDSASWIHAAAFGAIYFRPNDTAISSLQISDQSPSRKVWGKHADTLGPKARQQIEQEASILGVTWDELREKYGARMLYNAHILQAVGSKENKKVPVQSTLLEL